ncbi:MAG: DUF1326 domain-containing protein [Hyphomicrobiales bacterium]
MAQIEWEIRGPEIATCNCDYGCPCQFNALPTKGDCRATVGMRIEKGHFGDLSLDGVKWAAVAAWPGPIHEGNGEIFPIIDESATQKQREALLTIMSGGETDPMATFFAVFTAMCTTVHEPVFKPIIFEADLKAGTGRVKVDGLVDTKIEPIRNPMTGQEHRVRVVLAKGFEFTDAEFVSGTWKTDGPIINDHAGRHAHMANLHIGGHGIIR